MTGSETNVTPEKLKSGERQLQSNFPWAKLMNGKLDFIGRHKQFVKEFQHDNLESQMERFVEAVTMSSNERDLRVLLLKDVISLLYTKFPNVTLHPFGSYLAQIGDKDSDLDVVVDCHGTFENGGKSLDKPKKMKVFNEVHKTLCSNRFLNRQQLIFQIVPIRCARVPIIKFTHAPTNINCDISFENLLSVRNSKLVRFLIELDIRIQPLLCLIRYWGRFYALIDSNKIKNYGLILLVFVFLKQKLILPSIYELQHWDPLPSTFRVDFWNAAYYSNKEEIIKYLDRLGRPPPELNEFNQPTTISILELAADFFDFCRNIQPQHHVICTLTATFIPRSCFFPGNEHELPIELEDYKNFCAKIESDPSQSPLLVEPTKPLIIQDPFALNFNVSAVTYEKILTQFLYSCELGSSQIRRCIVNFKDEKRGNLMDIFFPPEALFFAKFYKSQLSLGNKTTSPPSTHSMEFKLQPSFDYILKFIEFCQKTFPNSVKDGIITSANALWLSFTIDFFKSYFSKCLGLRVKLEEIPLETASSHDVEGRNSSGEVSKIEVVDRYVNPFLAVNPIHTSESTFAEGIETSKKQSDFYQASTASKRQCNELTTSRPTTPGSISAVSKYARVENNRPVILSLEEFSAPVVERTIRIETKKFTESQIPCTGLLPHSDCIPVSKQKPIRLNMVCTLGVRIALDWMKRKNEGQRLITREGKMETKAAINGMDPLEVEAEITKRLTSTLSRKARKPNFSLDCTVLLKPVTETVVAEGELKFFDVGENQNWLENVNNLPNEIEALHKLYVDYHYKIWEKSNCKEKEQHHNSPPQRVFNPAGLKSRSGNSVQSRITISAVSKLAQSDLSRCAGHSLEQLLPKSFLPTQHDQIQGPIYQQF